MHRLTAGNERVIRAWLVHIEEDDPAEIQSVLDEFRLDPGALAYFLGRSKEVNQ
jgi:hypothetical protein